MKLMIIQPTHFRSRSDRSLHKSRRRIVVDLRLPYLAALTPKEWEVTLVDEQLQDVDFGARADVVALTAWDINSLRAYEIADRFRARKVPVIIGGPHTFFWADEAGEHCDAAGLGEGENIWPRMLEDAAAGRLKRTYRCESLHDLAGLPFPRYDLLPPGRYGLVKAFSVQSSRGCPFRCDFCSERQYLGEAYRCRPVEEVVQEIRRGRFRNILFADSNFTGRLSRTMELMEALVPLRIRWSALFPAYLCTRTEFLDLARRSGLLHLNIGIESIDRATLAGMNKKVNEVSRYGEVFRNLRRRGISFSVNLIFGWDSETPGVFASTLAFLKENRVPVAYFNILTPLKGTGPYERLGAQGRLRDPGQIGRWPGLECSFEPSYCSPGQLEAAVRDMRRRFYSLPSMLRRLPPPVTGANIASWVSNLAQHRVAVAGVGGEDFDGF